jgi:hypothetical protein
VWGSSQHLSCSLSQESQSRFRVFGLLPLVLVVSFQHMEKLIRSDWHVDQRPKLCTSEVFCENAERQDAVRP